MVWPTSWEGVAIGGNLRSDSEEGQSQRYQFMKGLPQSRVLRSEMDMREHARVATAEAQHLRISPTLPCTPAGRPLCPIPRGRSCTTLLLSNSISLDFLNVSRPHVRQFINTEYRKDIPSLWTNARRLTMLCECCSR